MKPSETIFKTKRKYAIIMILCFIYGGYSLIMFLYQLYRAFWFTEMVAQPSFGDMNADFNVLRQSPRGIPNAFRRQLEPVALFTSPNSLSLLFGGVISILAGIAIWALTREEEIKTAKQQMAAKLLLPDEKRVIDALKTSNYELTQAKIAKKTGLTKVQVHRAIKRLEARGAIEKHAYGLTNKIILKKEFLE